MERVNRTQRAPSLDAGRPNILEIGPGAGARLAAYQRRHIFQRFVSGLSSRVMARCAPGHLRDDAKSLVSGRFPYLFAAGALAATGRFPDPAAPRWVSLPCSGGQSQPHVERRFTQCREGARSTDPLRIVRPADVERSGTAILGHGLGDFLIGHCVEPGNIGSVSHRSRLLSHNAHDTFSFPGHFLSLHRYPNGAAKSTRCLARFLFPLLLVPFEWHRGRNGVVITDLNLGFASAANA